MSKRPVTPDEMRAIQLEILDSVHAFCMERGLRYSLGGGTLLGAVRHQGFIPWDDDIDIMLPRPDYERLLKEFPKTNTRYSIQNYKTTDNYSLKFTRIYDPRTILTETGIVDNKERLMLRNGVFIEAFAIDGLPAPENMDKYLKDYEDYGAHIWNSTKFLYFGPWQVIKYYIKRLIYRHINIRLKYSRKESIDRFEQYLLQYNFETSDYAGAITGAYGIKEHMPADTFRHYIDIPFEGKMYKAIADFNAYLTKHYGNYMQLPPKDQRTTGHTFKVYWK